ncbi:hypothetical protein D0837_17270 [Bordetella avium]|uniref:hypothetical protein n=1 Tax=Bordetella avium TaxID=521 RepID=UPI000E69A9E2|nr:hypothetical protein [Bordetella avium]RIQ79062.1 hypothetical protein D0837_17270 [Bordetella avium]
MHQSAPLRTVRSECGTYATIPAKTDEQRRADLESQLANDLRHALRTDQNVVFHYASGPSPQRVADFVRECGNAQADDLFAQMVGHVARLGPADAEVVSLARRWLALSEARAVQILADAVEDRQRVTFEARQ